MFDLRPDRHTIRLLLHAVLALLVTAALSACGGETAGTGDEDTDAGSAEAAMDEGPAAEPSAPLRETSLRLNFTIDASAATFYLARERGYYEEEGLDLEIGAGRGSLITAQTVASGQDEFGYITMDAAIQVITQDGRLKIVTALQRTAPYNVVYHPGPPIQSIEDLFERRILSNPNIPQTGVMQGLVASQGHDPEELDISFAEFAAYAGIYEADPSVAILGRPGGQEIWFKSINDVQAVTYNDLGLEFYGNALVTPTTLIDSEPDLVEGFVRASIRGWHAAIEDPEAAVDALLASESGVGDRDTLLAELEATLALTSGLGDSSMEVKPIDADSFERQVDFMVQYMDMAEPSVPLREYFTNSMLQ